MSARIISINYFIKYTPQFSSQMLRWCLSAPTPNKHVLNCLWNASSNKPLSHMADGRLFHTVGPWNTKLRWPIELCTHGSWMHPVDVDHSRWWPQTSPRGTHSSHECQRNTVGIKMAVLKMTRYPYLWLIVSHLYHFHYSLFPIILFLLYCQLVMIAQFYFPVCRVMYTVSYSNPKSCIVEERYLVCGTYSTRSQQRSAKDNW